MRVCGVQLAKLHTYFFLFLILTLILILVFILDHM